MKERRACDPSAEDAQRERQKEAEHYSKARTSAPSRLEKTASGGDDIDAGKKKAKKRFDWRQRNTCQASMSCQPPVRTSISCQAPGMLKTAFWGLQPLRSIYPGKIQVVGWAEAVLSIPGLNGCSPGRGLS